MRKETLFILAGLLIAFGALADPISILEQPTPQLDFSKADYYAAVEAFEMGTASKLQTSILELGGYFDEPPTIDYAGGPDGYGYMFRDSDEPDGPVYSWIDITGTGTQLMLGDEDNSGALILPFTFNFYGVDYTEFYIHDNGAITFTDQWVDYTSDPIPTANLNELIAPFWIDLDPSTGGEIWYGSATVNGQNAMIASYLNVPEYGGTDTVTFQVALLADGSIRFHYNSASPAMYTWESIGIQADGTTGLYISYDEDPLNYPYDGLAIEVYYDGGTQFATLSGYVYEDVTGTPLEGASVEVNGSFYYTDATGYYETTDLLPGDYNVRVRLLGYFRISEDITLVEGQNTIDWYLVPYPTPMTDPYFTDFEDDQGWFDPVGGVWMHGMPTVEPSGAYSGDYAWDTVIDGDYPNSAYAWLISTERWTIPVDGGWNINYKHWMDTEDYFDGYCVLLGYDRITFYFLTPDGGYSHDPGYLGYPVFSGSSGDWSEVNYDLSSWQGETVFVAFLFVSDGGIRYPGVAIDDFKIGPSQPPVEFIITPVGSTTIPPQGGVLTYDVMLQNNTMNTWSPLRYWTTIMLPGGNMSGPITCLSFGILPNMYLTASGLTQEIPDSAPAGDYVFYAHVGRIHGYRLTDEFVFSKEAPTRGMQPEGDFHTWNGSIPSFVPVTDNEKVTAAELPTEYEMAPVYPNPFNPSASVSIALPETAELRVTVFNVMGQQVAELANGQFNAGVQTFTIDGSALASGIYFVKVAVLGQLNEIQKVTLMK